jgi:hypothetical protein
MTKIVENDAAVDNRLGLGLGMMLALVIVFAPTVGGRFLAWMFGQ